MSGAANGFEPYAFERQPEARMQAAAEDGYRALATRRSVRDFSPEPVPRALIEWAIRTAASAPSGAHRQPWKFVAIDDPEIKRQIRVAAEAEEYASYVGGRMPESWREALAPLGTNWEKPFLEIAPWLIVVFEEIHRFSADGAVEKNYYVKESVGIACGFLIAAVHQMGLVTLTHTPSPMGFLSKILGRPANERPFMLFPVGYPAPEAVVPRLTRKSLEQVSIWFTKDHAASS